LDFPIHNTDRAVGAITSNENFQKSTEQKGLPENPLKLNSRVLPDKVFGLLQQKGLTMIVNGNTNDYLGKGLIRSLN